MDEGRSVGLARVRRCEIVRPQRSSDSRSKSFLPELVARCLPNVGYRAGASNRSQGAGAVVPLRVRASVAESRHGIDLVPIAVGNHGSQLV